ncbi:MAG TPA: MotA/TolQ/ExbB proton channel family protein [Kofleriaceae bacterium]|nr:MotA/TolQ/ExbB proton channel family protein [Kofleriaceae bacterium]
MNLAKAFVEFAQLGADWVLWLLIALSILSVGVMIDRFLWFRGRDADTERFNRELRGAFERDELERVIAKYRDSSAIPVQVALRGLAEVDHGPEAVAEAMHGERARWRKTADRNLIVLGTLGNNVPFVGLFGTVLGVMKAFLELTVKTPEAETRTLQTISEALAATAFGLIVAIPAVVAFNYFSRRLKVLMTGADECAHQVLSLVHGIQHRRSSGASANVVEPTRQVAVGKQTEPSDGGE